MTKENIFEPVINGLFSAIKKENIALYKDLITKYGDFLKDDEIDVSDFDILVLHPFEQFIEGWLTIERGLNEDQINFLLNIQFYQNHIEQLFERWEGSFASADKSRTIIGALFGWLKTKEEIKFNYDQEYTYHLPKKILKTHQEITQYYDGLKSLYYGKPQKYLEFYKDLLVNHNEGVK